MSAVSASTVLRLLRSWWGRIARHPESPRRLGGDPDGGRLWPRKGRRRIPILVSAHRGARALLGGGFGPQARAPRGAWRGRCC